ncbi:hypothetical protein BD779DRAFT_148726 [Infundibulicybe gibba]|nr:hypothetical protein BD779DRAFT_148726 [Infundibulicybe gibba]
MTRTVRVPTRLPSSIALLLALWGLFHLCWPPDCLCFLANATFAASHFHFSQIVTHQHVCIGRWLSVFAQVWLQLLIPIFFSPRALLCPCVQISSCWPSALSSPTRLPLQILICLILSPPGFCSLLHRHAGRLLAASNIDSFYRCRFPELALKLQCVSSPTWFPVQKPLLFPDCHHQPPWFC